MEKGTRYQSIYLPGMLFLLLVIGSKAASQGVAEGITQCMQVVIPSLFPFFFITGWFNSSLQGFSLSSLRTPEKLLGIPKGCGNILLTGLLGGYPVGAKTIADAHENNIITAETAHIMLGYCNNAGPSFIFGICNILFPFAWIPWVIWGIQILSAVVTALLLPRPHDDGSHRSCSSESSMTSVLRRSISATVMVCGWILLFKTFMHLLIQIPLFRSLIPFTAGFLELSNGCLMLTSITSPAFRFVLFSLYLSAGGLCVYLQTVSAVDSVGSGLYLPGKCIQSAVCGLISVPVSVILFKELPFSFPIVLTAVFICSTIIIILPVICRKTCGNCETNRV